MASQVLRGAAALAVFALGTSVLGAPGWSQPGGADTALGWLRSGTLAPRQVSYEGTKSITVWGGQVRASQVRVYHAAPDHTRLEYLAAGAQPRRIVIIKGRTQMEYVPASNQVIQRPAPQADEDLLTRAVLPEITHNYNVEFSGAEQVAGRETRVIDIKSKFQGRPSLRVWVDRETRLILRFERYRPDGTLQQTSTFISIRFDPVLSSDLFTVVSPPGAQVQQGRNPRSMTIEEIAQRVGFTPRVPSYLPAGFQAKGARVVDVRGQPVATLVYSDGVSTLTMFESRGPQGPPPKGRRVRVGSVEGTVTARGVATLLHWNVGGISYTLVGDLPEDDLIRVAASVPAVSGFRPAHRSAFGAIAVAEAASGPGATAAPGRDVPPVPIAPYITNDTHPAGAGVSADGVPIWRALAAAGLTPFVVKVTVAGDGLGAGRLAWLWFVYGMDWTGGGAAAVHEVAARARALAVTAFRADPRVAQVVLTGQYHVRGPFDVRRTDATFTARLERDPLLAGPPGLEAELALARAGDVWYSPALRAGALVVHRPRPHESRRARGLPGDRSVESAEHFDGSLPQRIVETKRRLDGILFGLESDGRLWRGNPRRREIALTFDDGPDPVATPLLLAILRRFGARATFFVIGERGVPYPYLIKQMAADGHEVGNHTFHHPKLTTLDPRTIREELAATTEAIDPIAGPPRWFRPPGGDYSPQVAGVAREAGLNLAMWTVNSGDWAAPPPKLLAERVLARAEPGAIILLHNGTLGTVRALPEIIVDLKRRGYDLVTVSELARGTE